MKGKSCSGTRSAASRCAFLFSWGTEPMRSVAFSPDGRTIGLAEQVPGARNLVLLDVETGRNSDSSGRPPGRSPGLGFLARRPHPGDRQAGLLHQALGSHDRERICHSEG